MFNSNLAQICQEQWWLKFARESCNSFFKCMQCMNFIVTMNTGLAAAPTSFRQAATHNNSRGSKGRDRSQYSLDNPCWAQSVVVGMSVTLGAPYRLWSYREDVYQSVLQVNSGSYAWLKYFPQIANCYHVWFPGLWSLNSVATSAVF